MMEATLETLLLSGAVSCRFIWRKRQKVMRTIEIHTDGVLYCFDEPKDSMAKNLRERLYLFGSRVVDCGTHRGRLCFGLELADASSVEQLRPSGLFTSLRTSAPVSPLKNEGSLSKIFVAFFFVGNKLLKWRFIHLLRLASSASPPFLALQQQEQNVALSAICGSRENDDSRGIYRVLERPSRIIDVTGDGPLEMHEVEQLEDVLRLYEENKRLKQEEEENNDEEESLRESVVTCDDDKMEVPERLMQSPLYALCIADRPSNQICADCGEKWPTWAVLGPFGCFVCIHCVGVHRQLRPHCCREVQLDNWDAAEIDFMAKRGNDVVNDELEYAGFFLGSGDAVYKPVGSSSRREVREEYITLKYEGTFTRERNPHVLQAMLPPPDRDVQGHLDISKHGALNHDGPPQYIGVAYINVREVEGIRSSGAVLSLTNGFQEVRSRAGVVPSGPAKNNPCHACTCWEESFQLGVYSVTAPLFMALYTSGDELLGAAEWRLPDGVALPGCEPQLVKVPLFWCLPSEGSTWPTFNPFGGGRRHRRRDAEKWHQPLLYITVSFAHFG
ncbi:putative GTP-ase activating protein [Trypanosoma cruzi]|uniref:GTP-ase activating protein, putative n=2 Tax=Trypanosoma cruzi TaxID=5693 RepID=Q4D8K1_TRYCC|nr:GTP-ase activating protein, putative [Trypanosoma cruzi]EAN88853.1 GTP-ase activating protein, putative [Trypanosoma cruzi]PWV10333.1 putative GTP-ase activating protein [Trypanosoma cruzi]RNC61133.1 putative GTP-ase activating protein [Trypanosoma cruzi]|eukprot:XP_810704.1 GTP-ase activating protein [Trypanosoma cruzi strain CL Brener]